MSRIPLILCLGACATMFAGGCKTGGEPPQTSSPQVEEVERVGAGASVSADATPQTAPAGQAMGYFAGGCFWGVEHFLEQLPGVIDVESGYMGGDVPSPSYEVVSHTDSGHVETVRVTYDPSKIDYRAVTKRFFEIHDPTEVNRQGPDIGKQYRSAVFVNGPEERKVVEALIGELQQNGYAVATAIEQAKTFWPAEDYHQNYYARTGKTPYCHAPVPRFERRAGE